MKLVIFWCAFHLFTFKSANSQTIKNDPSELDEYELGAEFIQEDTMNITDVDNKWIKVAVVNSGYFLRNHKFNDFDRRFYTDIPTTVDYVPLYGSFPSPPLKVFHWDVFSHCKENFSTCLRFIYETAVDSYLQYSADSAIIIKKQNWTRDENLQQIQLVDKECKQLVELDRRTMQPFKGPLERFQWRTTASYYMCYYTMLETAELKHFDEPCDDYGQCTWDDYVSGNGDYRADDRIPFQCAKYSFCPDPCCQTGRLLTSTTEQIECQKNPCRELQNKSCNVSPRINRNFVAMIYNEWNVSCVCDELSGYQWESRYGMCVDYDECKHETVCDEVSQACFNTPGSYECACSYGYTWSTSTNRCLENERLTYAAKRFAGISTPEEGKAIRHRRSSIFLVSIIFTITLPVVHFFS